MTEDLKQWYESTPNKFAESKGYMRGPWEINGENKRLVNICTTKGYVIAFVNNDSLTEGTIHKNIIKTSPELLEACELALCYLQNHDNVVEDKLKEELVRVITRANGKDNINGK